MLLFMLAATTTGGWTISDPNFHAATPEQRDEARQESADTPAPDGRLVLRIYGASWCRGCQQLERQLESYGFRHSVPAVIDGSRVAVEVRHVPVNSPSTGSERQMRSIPEVQLLVEGHVFGISGNEFTSCDDFTRFIEKSYSAFQSCGGSSYCAPFRSPGAERGR